MNRQREKNELVNTLEYYIERHRDWPEVREVLAMALECINPKVVGVRAKILPNPLTEKQFQAYVELKRVEKPLSEFFANEPVVREWLLTRHSIEIV